MIALGIDPGVHGAVARLAPGEPPRVWPAPVTMIRRGKRMVRVPDFRGMWELLQEATTVAATGVEAFCALELARAIPPRVKEGEEPRGSGAVGMFNYGLGYGAWQMALTGLGIPYACVHPATWKKAMLRDVGSAKGAAILVAHRLFPGVSLRPPRARKDHDGLAEALLLAEYARRIGRPAEAAREAGEAFA